VDIWKAWDEILLMRESFQEVLYLQKIVVPARDIRRDEHTSLKIKWKRNLNLLSQTTAIKNEYISKNKKSNYCRYNHSNHQIFFEK
jgi:hypothetical protein